MLVKVFFGENTGWIHVADVTASDEHKDYPKRALEYAYTSTQNISGSWSRGPMVQIDNEYVVNADYNENVKVVEPLPVINGKTYGHRSSMVGDIFSVNDEMYRVDYNGFEHLGPLSNLVRTFTRDQDL